MARSRQLAGLGNIAAKDGHFSEAVRRFTEAIDLYPFDHRSVSKGREGLHMLLWSIYPVYCSLRTLVTTYQCYSLTLMDYSLILRHRFSNL